MSRVKSDNVYAGCGFWYIRYKHPVTNKWNAVSTKLKSSRRNYKFALEFRDSFMAELEKAVDIEVRHGDVQFAFNKFKELNASKSDSTRESYDFFFGYMIQRIKPDTPCFTINKDVAEDFLLWLNKLEHLQQNTKFGIQKNFQKFLNYLLEKEYVTKPIIISKDVKIRAKVNEPLIFSDADRNAILDRLSSDLEISQLLTQKKEDKEYKKKQKPVPYVKNSNFRTMVMMLMYTGLRPSDIINITTDHVDLKKMEMKFYSSKIDKWFIRPIHTLLKEVLANRISEVKTGRLLDYGEVKNMGKAFNRYLEAINLSGKGYTLRTFRKDFISRCQEAGIDIATTALLVGHSNIRVTMSYYTKLSSQHLTDELSKLK